MNYVVLSYGTALPNYINNIEQAKKYFNNTLLNKYKKLIIPYLKKGGFEFGADLWKNFRIKISKFPVEQVKITYNSKTGKINTTKKIVGYKNLRFLLFDIYFEDTNNDGCEYILQQIKKSGLLNSDIWIKNKCLIIP
jgi:hypothetical protein